MFAAFRILLFLFLILLSSHLVFALPPPVEFQSLISSASHAIELDSLLSTSHITFPTFSATDDLISAEKKASDLISATQKARLAISSHVLSTPHPLESTAVDRARKLQSTLHARIQSQLSSQLNGLANVGEVEWGLHRGFTSGVVESKEPTFTARVLTPERFQPAPNTRWERVKRVLQGLDPISAIKRYRIRRLARQLDDTEGSLEQVRARLSALTAIKATQKKTAAAEARDAEAAKKIEDAPVIHSDLNIKLPSPTEDKPRVIKMKSGWDGITPGEQTWIKAYNAQRHRKPFIEDWNSIPIPGIS